MSHLDKLDKKTLDRHFPNKSHGGKGSFVRKQTSESLKNYKSNSFWDNCEFEKNKRIKEGKKGEAGS